MRLRFPLPEMAAQRFLMCPPTSVFTEAVETIAAAAPWSGHRGL